MTSTAPLRIGFAARLAAVALPLFVAGFGAFAADGQAIPSACKFGNLTFYPTGRILKISGVVCANDQYRFSQFLASVPSRDDIKIVELQGGGGDIDAALSIGYQIRIAGFATLTDAAAGDCIGPCAFMFAAGVARHYVNADGVVPGVTPLRSTVKPPVRIGLGLQFPFKSKGTDSETLMAFFERFVVPFYRALLPPAAAEATIASMKANQTSDVLVLNAQTAISSGLATSLAPP